MTKRDLLAEVRIAPAIEIDDATLRPESYFEMVELDALAADRDAKAAAAKTKAAGDRIIIKTMRFAVWGLGAILVMFVTYIIATLYIGAHDNRRIDELELRVEKLEHHR